MKPEIKEMWVNALRSEEYSQAKNALHTSEGFCCLGVLCDLYLKESQTETYKWMENFTTGYYFGSIKEPMYGKDYLPNVVVEWSGLTHENPIIKYDNSTMHISDLNDEGKSFEVIADVIEEQL